MKTEQQPLTITALDEEGRGVTHIDGKVCFLTDALIGETVTSYRLLRNKKNYAVGEALSVRNPSSLRSKPLCPHFGVCGGCSLQHIDVGAQVAIKQRVLEDALSHIGKVHPEQILSPIYGIKSGYRFRARMSVKYVAKKGGVLVGFHEKASPFVADMMQCKIVPQHVSDLIMPLRELIGKLSVRDKLPQIEWAVGARVTVIAFRILQNLNAEDEKLLKNFIDFHQSDKHPLQLWLQPGKADSLQPFYPQNMPPLSFRLPEFDLELLFHPTEFTQVNHQVNEIMVSRAMNLLRPQSGEVIADMFCGLGNFSLPIARSGVQVYGVEGSQALTARASQNAQLNGLSELCDFQVADLFKPQEFNYEQWLACDKWLIDPPRDGAFELARILNTSVKPHRVVYVSCKPATLARDAEVLQANGYKIKLAGVMNMFAHTSHVESVALFEC